MAEGTVPHSHPHWRAHKYLETSAGHTGSHYSQNRFEAAGTRGIGAPPRRAQESEVASHIGE
ncbi:hypothetical protein RSAG8_13039, partial [Rhizoctonia solani AG-8 WAC10335]